RGALRSSEVARARDHAEEMLRKSEGRLQDIINTSADWIWECDEQHRFTFSSPSIGRVLGYGRHELLQTTAYDYVFAPDHARLREAFSAAEGDTDTAVPVVLRWRHKDGQVRFLVRKTVGLRAEDGGLRGFRGIDRDVTTRTTQEERIARLNRAISCLSGANAAIVRIRDRRERLR